MLTRRFSFCTKFLSTPSGWRATNFLFVLSCKDIHFYPRPPGGGRPDLRCLGRFQFRFLSTPSGWRATQHRHSAAAALQHFYPRPPGGGRRARLRLVQNASIFLSTPSGWRATYLRDLGACQLRISIHALRVEGDSPISRSRLRIENISIHALRVEGDFFGSLPHLWLLISIHALRVEGDNRQPVGSIGSLKFLSTPSGWRATS